MGDFEEVEDYLLRQQMVLEKPHPKRSNFSDDNPCTVSNFDAIASLRNELFVFIGKVPKAYVQMFLDNNWKSIC